MNKKVIITIKKEIRGIIRDKKSLLMMLLTPLMIPLFIFMFSLVYDTLINGEDGDIKYNIGLNYNLSIEEENIISNMDLNTKYYSSKEELDKAYKEGLIDAYIIKENNNYIIYTNSMSEDSSLASNLATSYLEAYNEYLASNYLVSIEANIDNVYNNVIYNYEELQGTNDFAKQIISSGFIFAIMAISLTAIYCATDSTAGEKERGTLETILTFPIKSEELITGKYLAITISCFITSILSTFLVVISLLISKNIFSIYKDTILNINFINISMALLIMFAFSIFISGLCIAIASLTKSYKEAQSALTPISLFTMIPLFLDILEIDLTPLLSLIPIISHTMLLNVIFCDSLKSIDIINIIVMFISTIIYSIIIIKLITRQYKSEKVLFSI